MELEGKGRYHKKEFVQFLYNARGSLYEVVTLLQLALNLRYLGEPEHQQAMQIAQVVMSKLSGLINSLKLPAPSPEPRARRASLEPRALSPFRLCRG